MFYHLNNQLNKKQSAKSIKNSQIISPYQRKQLPSSSQLSKSTPYLQNIGSQSQQTQIIQQFIEEVATDPSLLLKLINYQELIKNLKRQQLQIKQKIQFKKLQLQKRRKQRQLPINQASQQIYFLNQQVKKYIKLISQIKQRKRLRNQQKMYEHKKIIQQISFAKTYQKEEINKIQNKINHYLNIKTQLNLKTQKLNKQFGKIKNNVLQSKQGAIKRIKFAIKEANSLFINLKNQQKQEISKYKNNIVQKKTNQFEYKKNCERKLNNFIEQLSKSLQKTNRQQLDRISITYQQKKPDIRAKNFTSDKKPDENEESWQAEKQIAQQKLLQNMEQTYPVLKKYRNMNIKSLQSLQTKIQQKQTEKEQQICQSLKKVKVMQQKINKLSKQQVELDQFIISLKQKLTKISKQII